MIRASVLVVLLAACSKTADKEAPPAPAPSASASVVTASSAAPKASASSAASAAPTGAAKAYAWTYSLAPASFYIPDSSGWNGVKQVKDDPSKSMGDGEISLSVDPTGKVTGAIESGPASPAVIEGQMVEDEIRGNVRRRTPDDGLTGTIVAKPAGDGKMALADGTSAIVREAKLTLKKN